MRARLGNPDPLWAPWAGWAEAFLHGEFSGFVAPLWSVYDSDAYTLMSEFFEQLLKYGRAPSQILQEIRKGSGAGSATFLSFLYHGDVMASMTGQGSNGQPSITSYTQ
jgi:hypothetical protein